MNDSFKKYNLSNRKVSGCKAPGRGVIGCSVLILSFFFSGMVQADRILEDLSDNDRLKRLERMVSSDALRKRTQTIQSLREEISALREQVEQQAFELSSMKQRQRNLYRDIDRRINKVGVNGVPMTGSTNSSPGSAAGGVSTTGNSSAATTGDGHDVYTKAFTLLKEGQYAQSITAFKAFKKAYPNSKYASNAQYWLGEANYVLRDYKKALVEFQQLISQHPDSSKIPGARLKIAYVYYELKKWSAARDALHQVIGLYPEASVAKKAKERLARMKREKH